MNSPVELWKKHPDIDKIEVSSFGRVRSVKGHYYTSCHDHGGYLLVGFRMNGKHVSKLVHRLVAQAFIPNPNNLPQVNHKDSDRTNNNVSNLEWCNNSYNQIYMEKFGISNTESRGKPVFAINLTTLEVSRFRSQHEAERALGVYQANINSVIRGRYKQTGGYWFVNDDGHKDAQIQQKIVEGQQAVAQKQAEVDAKQQTINDLTSKLEAAKQANNGLSQAIKDAQSIKDYSDQAVKSVSAK